METDEFSHLHKRVYLNNSPQLPSEIPSEIPSDLDDSDDETPMLARLQSKEDSFRTSSPRDS